MTDRLIRAGALVLLLAGFVIPAAGALEEAVAEKGMKILFPAEIRGGELMSVLVVSPEAGECRVTLRGPDGTEVVSAPTFPAVPDVKTGGGEAETALLGIPSTLTEGTYRLELGRGGELLWSGTVRGIAGSFRREEIPLNREMTDLRSEPDPRKVAEAVLIQQIYASFNRRAAAGRPVFRLPVEGGTFTSWYGDRRRYLYSDGTDAFSIHTGVDIASPTGTPVTAGAEGVVVFAGDRIVTGGTVVIEHVPGVYGVFFHLDRVDANEGDRVERDTRIGTVGSTGLATGPHLHWEIRVAGVPVDPLALLKEGDGSAAPPASPLYRDLDRGAE